MKGRRRGRGGWFVSFLSNQLSFILSVNPAAIVKSKAVEQTAFNPLQILHVRSVVATIPLKHPSNTHLIRDQDAPSAAPVHQENLATQKYTVLAASLMQSIVTGFNHMRTASDISRFDSEKPPQLHFKLCRVPQGSNERFAD